MSVLLAVAKFLFSFVLSLLLAIVVDKLAAKIMSSLRNRRRRHLKVVASA